MEHGGTDFSDLINIANSPAGQNLLHVIQENSSEQFQMAIQYVQDGNIDKAKEIMDKILATPQTEALMRQLRSEI